MVFWLRDFVLNLLANFVAGLFEPATMMGYLLAIAFAAWAVWGWHSRERAAKKPGMASWQFISLCFLVAAIAIAGGAYGLGLRGEGKSDQEKIAGPLQQKIDALTASNAEKDRQLAARDQQLQTKDRELQEARQKQATPQPSPMPPMPGQLPPPRTPYPDGPIFQRTFVGNDELQSMASALREASKLATEMQRDLDVPRELIMKMRVGIADPRQPQNFAQVVVRDGYDATIEKLNTLIGKANTYGQKIGEIITRDSYFFC